nr:ComEC/Rec2 family competence protein [Sphingomonas oleivorans]
MRAWAGEAIETWLEAERDQLALWLPVGLGLGIAAWFILPDAAGWLAFLLVAAGISGLGFVLARGGRLGHATGLFALAAAIGCAIVWGRAEHVAAPRLERPLVVTFSATVEALQPSPARDVVRLTLLPDAAAGLPPRIRVNAGLGDVPAGLGAGARLSLRARLMPPPPAAVPGAYDFARTAWFQGLGATGRTLGPVTLAAPAGRAGWSAWLADLRMRLSAHIREQAGGAEGGIAAAFVTGDQGAIAEEDAEAMRRSGLAHLLSISGLHVTAVIAATMFVLMRLLALSPRLALGAPLLTIAAAGGALMGIGYTLIAGAEVPTIRSCIAALLVLAGMAMGREAITLRLVATGALILLLARPEALAGPSFQLSFAAVTAIVALHEHPGLRAFLARREEGWGGRIGRSFLSLMLTGIVVEAALAPIALFHFHRAGLYGAFANIIAIPLTTFILMPLEAGALLLDAVGLGAPLWWLTAKSLALLLWLAHHVADAPGAVAALPSMPYGAFALMVTGGLWLALWRTRMRRIGLLPVALGMLWALLTPPPDILVTGDGRHLALRSGEGRLALLRPRAGDYVRDLLGESAGVEEEALALDGAPDARCGPDLCAVDIFRDGRRWRLLATRSSYLVDIGAMNRACAAADIVVSDRRLPRGCRPRWLKADRPFLARTGGLAINLTSGQVRTAAGTIGRHPWRWTD